MAPRLAYVGMGGIGSAMTKRLASRAPLGSTPLLIYNRTQSTAHAVAASTPNTRVATSLDEVLAHADIIWSCLTNEAAVLAVYERLLADRSKAGGKLFVESSSIPPDTSNELQRRAQEVGAEFVAVPVIGDPTMAEAGQLITISAGTRDAVKRVEPYLAGVTSVSNIDLSDQPPAQALVLKLVSNTLGMNVAESVAEALVFAEKAGVGEAAMANLIQAQYPVGPHPVYLKRMTSGQYVTGPVRGSVSGVLGVISVVKAMAEKAGVSLPAYEAARESFRLTEEKGHGQDDLSAIYGVLREKSGLPYNNKP